MDVYIITYQFRGRRHYRELCFEEGDIGQNRLLIRVGHTDI